MLRQKMLLAFILACCGVCSADDFEQQEPLGNFKNPTGVKDVSVSKDIEHAI
ncbi:MAG TPA: hypothetical protein VMX13_08385 [Sedimentisphaerales bacterium]|nr:hypothetical protein [Sedimentisphaerales bacterium]